MNVSNKFADGPWRCAWCQGQHALIDYHDTEWGFPVGCDERLFEKLCLESFQAGLNWRTILAKREGFRQAFLNFDFVALSEFTDRDVERLMHDGEIVRNRAKIEALVHNANRALELVKEQGSLAHYFWGFEPKVEGKTLPQAQKIAQAAGAVLAQELKKRGWKFMGPTLCYSFMQAMGLINDHAPGCSIGPKVDRERLRFERP